MKVVVTGAAGFIGHHLVQQLLLEGHDVLALDLRVPADVTAPSAAQAHWQVMDILDLHGFSELLGREGADVLVHTAAYGVQVGQQDWGRIFAANVTASLNAVEASARAGVKRVVHLGTSNEYGSREGTIPETAPLDPLTPYGATKAAAYLLCRERAKGLGLQWVELRPFLCFGPGEREEKFLPSLIGPLLRSEVPAMTGGEQVRDFVYVKDVAAAIGRAVAAELPPGTAINLGTGKGLRLRDVAQAVLERFPEGRIAYGAKPYRQPEVWHQVADTSLSRELLGWSPETSLDAALRDTISSYKWTGPS